MPDDDADVIRLGAELGHPMEPSQLFGRVVAIRKDPDVPPRKRVVVRQYQATDRLGIPTGELVIPHWILRYEPREGK